MYIVIDGAGEVGSHLAKMLRAEGNKVKVIDNDAGRLGHLSSTVDVETVLGNPTSLNVLRGVGISSADLFIAVCPYSNQEINIVAAILAKNLGASRVIARINDEESLSPENKLLYKEMGIEFMFYPERIAADEICSLLKHTTSSETMDFEHGKLQIAVFRLDENSPVLDMKLVDFTAGIPAEEAKMFRIIAISRGDDTLIPSYDTIFRFNDLVFTISKKEGVESLAGHFGKQSILVKSVMIVGGTQIAEMLARDLARQGMDVKLIDKNRERCIELSEKLPDTVMVINGDGRNSDFLCEESISGYDAFISLTSSDETNVLACVVAKKLGVSRTIAEVENIEYIRLAEEMGVDSVINKKLITAGRIFKFTLSGRARFVRYMSGTNAEVIEYTVAPGSAITKGALKEMNFPKNAIIGGVIRGGESMIAVGDTRIEPYDKVAVFALPQTIRDIDKFFK